jgi:hypothetical protein
LRSILAAWDFREEGGWRPHFDLLTSTEPDITGQEVESWLATFAASPIRRELESAVEIHREVEFVTGWPDDSRSGPSVRGRIDVLWRCRAGEWRLLAWDVAAPVADDPWQGRWPALMLQALAVRRQLGTWPRAVSLFTFRRGRATTVEALAERVAALFAHRAGHDFV